jgi:hypothetical protein
LEILEIVHGGGNDTQAIVAQIKHCDARGIVEKGLGQFLDVIEVQEQVRQVGEFGEDPTW